MSYNESRFTTIIAKYHAWKIVPALLWAASAVMLYTCMNELQLQRTHDEHWRNIQDHSLFTLYRHDFSKNISQLWFHVVVSCRLQCTHTNAFELEMHYLLCLHLHMNLSHQMLTFDVSFENEILSRVRVEVFSNFASIFRGDNPLCIHTVSVWQHHVNVHGIFISKMKMGGEDFGYW